MPAITHLLFDCDNTLVLSEEIAFETCADLANEILTSHDLPNRFTGPELQSAFVGQNFRGMMTSLQEKYNFKMSDSEFESYVTMEEDRIIAALKERAQPCIGANEQLEKLYGSGKYGLAVVSSSALRRVQASIEKAVQDKYFPLNHIFSAASSLPKPTSKPDPAIYLFACEKIGKRPIECVAIEDSVSGCKSAVAAGIWVVGYVGAYEEHEQDDKASGLKEAGAKVIMKDWKEFLTCLEEIGRI